MSATTLDGSNQTRKRGLSPRVSEIVSQRDGTLPVWVRAPVVGVEHFSGLTRAKLYQLAGDGKIRSVSLREPGSIKGCRLFHLRSILDYYDSMERAMRTTEVVTTV